MTKDEAMKLALEALEEIKAEFRALDLPYGSKAYTKANTASNTLREALDEPVQQQPVGYAHYEKGRLVLLGRSDCCMDMFPLYLAPTRREWIGLTFGEQTEIIERYYDDEIDLHDFARAIEAKLKELNPP